MLQALLLAHQRDWWTPFWGNGPGQRCLQLLTPPSAQWTFAELHLPARKHISSIELLLGVFSLKQEQTKHFRKAFHMDGVEQNKVGAKANIGSKRKLRKTRHDALRKVNIQAATQGYEKGILNKKD